MPSILPTLEQQDVHNLLTHSNELCVSIYMDSSEFIHDPCQNATRLKNLVREAKQLLPDEVPAWFLPLQELAQQNSAAWIERAPGIGLFSCENFLLKRALPFSPNNAALVETGFNLRPLLPALSEAGVYYVLAIDPIEPSLYRADNHSISQLAETDLVKTLAETRGDSNFSGNLGFHAAGPTPSTGGPATPKYHAQGPSAGDYKQIQLDQFAQRLAKSVDEILKSSEAPLVLVSDPNLLGSYRDHASYPSLLKESVDKNPSGMSIEQIHRATQPLVEERLDQPRRTSLSKLRQLVGTSKRYPGLQTQEIVKGSADGRVEVLFVSPTVQLYGAFDERERRVSLDRDRKNGGRDLVSFCLAHTLSHGGQVFAVSDDDLPNAEGLAAIFRY